MFVCLLLGFGFFSFLLICAPEVKLPNVVLQVLVPHPLKFHCKTSLCCWRIKCYLCISGFSPSGAMISILCIALRVWCERVKCLLKIYCGFHLPEPWSALKKLFEELRSKRNLFAVLWGFVSPCKAVFFEQVTFFLVVPLCHAGCPGNTETGWALLQGEQSCRDLSYQGPKSCSRTQVVIFTCMQRFWNAKVMSLWKMAFSTVGGNEFGYFDSVPQNSNTDPYLKNSGLMFDIRGSLCFSTAGLTIFYFLVWLSGLALILRSLLSISFSSNQLILAPASFSVKIVLLQFPALLWFGFSTSCSLGTSIFTSFDLSDVTVLVVAIVQQSEVILICQSNIFLS